MLRIGWLLFALSAITAPTFAAQSIRPASGADEAAVRAADARYWQMFNTCDLNAMSHLLTADAEFYHDKTGLTSTSRGVIDSLRKGPCADTTHMRLRREAVPGSVRFYPLAGGFAMLMGKHRFYVDRPGKPEYLDGEAAFVTLWQLDHGNWRMRRIISYNHHPVPYVPPKPSMALTPAQAARCVGRYRTPDSGDIVVTAESGHLKLVSGKLTVTLYPESAQRFFAAERDLRCTFGDDRRRKAQTVTVYEHGAVVAAGHRVD